MKSQKLRKLMTAGLMASILSCALALGEERATPRPAAQPAAHPRTERRQVDFKTERTDSWLCAHVSVFFCSNLFPTLGSTNANTSQTSSVPDRSRH
jgi:hypothetical protein